MRVQGPAENVAALTDSEVEKNSDDRLYRWVFAQSPSSVRLVIMSEREVFAWAAGANTACHPRQGPLRHFTRNWRTAGPSPMKIHSFTSPLDDRTKVISSPGLTPAKVVSLIAFNGNFGLVSAALRNCA